MSGTDIALPNIKIVGLAVVRQWKRWTRRNRIWRSYRVAVLLLRTLYIINRERSRVIHARQRGDYEVRPNLEALLRILREFRRTAIDLGGLLIKLGQFLGARADLLPQEALAELAMLHDEVPAERFEDIKRVLEREWHAPVGEVCAVIDAEPTGSASLGQVHRARLHDGRIVAVKVQRPGIAGIVRTDLRTLRFVLRIVRWLAPIANRITDLDALYREFSRTVYEELDYHQEARNARRFAEIFADDPFIWVPDVIPEYTTRHVLVLKWMDGIKITDFDALDVASVDRLELANRLTGAYLKQVLEASFFHADPHPGNLLVQPDPDGDRIVFVDFGMMGVITPRMRGGLRDCFTGVVTQDAERIVRGLDALGFIGDAADREALGQVVGTMLAHYTSNGVSSWRRGGPNPREVLGDVESTVYDQPFRLPAQFAFFGRMAGMMLGLTSALSPRYNFIQVATPYAQQFIGRSGAADGILRLLGVESVEALGRDLLRDGIATARSLAALPRRLENVLERAERGELHFVVESAAVARVRKRRSRRAMAGLINRPVPMWLPLGLVGAYAVTRLLWRQLPRGWRLKPKPRL
jgi:predicted unusual protein kinase regulating ubiquinone biosynthesis (AarF/ABC1/UbiB family)